jgi:hypothetical protein
MNHGDVKTRQVRRLARQCGTTIRTMQRGAVATIAV